MWCRLVSAAAASLLAACFAPAPPSGAPCNPDAACPAGLSCLAGVCVPDEAGLVEVGFASASSLTDEAFGGAAIDIVLSAPAPATVTVTYQVTGGSASPDVDYTLASGVVELAPGETTRMLAVTVARDPDAEGDETIAIALTAPTGARLGIAEHTVTIQDRVCYGAGAAAVCLATAPADPVSLPATIDTDTSTLCMASDPVAWLEAGQPSSCTIAGSGITVPGTTTVTGSRPLVLVASETITVAGTLIAASRRGATTGPGALSAPCPDFVLAPANGSTGAGGGAGGSFMSRGGDGGAGDGGAVIAGAALPEEPAVPTLLRAGCPGQLGGKAMSNSSGAIGQGGGVVYLVAGASLSISGTIDASGAGAASGEARTGGSGAGSGGMIKLHAPTSDVTGARLLANGGGGASGGGASQPGVAGANSTPSLPASPAAGGASVTSSGAGGAGFAGATPAQAGAAGAPGTGGGGGGGGGGLIQSNTSLAGAIASAGVIDAP